MDERMIDVSNKLNEISISHERALAVCDEINQSYFDLDQDIDKLYYFDRYRVLSDILFDYLIRMDEQLGNLMRFVDK